MAKKEGRNKNRNDEANMPDGILLNATADTLVLAANPERMSLHFHNGDSVKGCWVKFQATGLDADKKGLFLDATGNLGSNWDMVPDNVYTGEICAIADSGSPMLYVVEY